MWAIYNGMNTETIFTSYRAVEQYLQLIDTATGAKPMPEVSLKGIDTFLMSQIVACHPAAPSIIDLAGDATLGASTIFWASQGTSLTKVFSGRAHWQPARPDWSDWVVAALETLGLSKEKQIFLGEPLDQPESWQAVANRLNKLAPLIVAVAYAGESPLDVEQRLQWLVGLHEDAIVLLLSVGLTGDSPVIGGALCLTGNDSLRRLVLLREVSPFFGASELGILFRRDNQHITDTLMRLRELYDGNFSFISLMENNHKMSETLKAEMQTLRLAYDSSLALTPPINAPKSLSLRPPSFMVRAKEIGIGYTNQILRRQAIQYKASYLKCTLPRRMQVLSTYEGELLLRNDSGATWSTPPGSKKGYSVSYHWRTPDGTLLIKEGRRSPLPSRIEPGQSVIANFGVTTPDEPGDYILELDLIHEGVAWFSDAGVVSPSFAINVQK